MLDYAEDVLADDRATANRKKLYGELRAQMAQIYVANKVVYQTLEQLAIAAGARPNAGVISLYGGDESYLMFEGIDTLTSTTLRDEVVPYLEAITNIERILANAKGIPFVEPVYTSISLNSPLEIFLKGGTLALQFFTRYLPDEREMRKLEKDNKQLQNEKLRTEIFSEKIDILDKLGIQLTPEEKDQVVAELMAEVNAIDRKAIRVVRIESPPKLAPLRTGNVLPPLPPTLPEQDMQKEVTTTQEPSKPDDKRDNDDDEPPISQQKKQSDRR